MELQAKLLKWGNSYALRLTKAEFSKMGLPLGTEVTIDLEPNPISFDVSDLPTFVPVRSEGAEGEAAWAAFQEKMDG